MAELQERLATASAVARLDEIVGALRTSDAPLSDSHRQWLAELLSGFAKSTGGQSLTPGATRRSLPRAEALVQFIQESSDIQARVHGLVGLCTALASGAVLDRQFTLELALSVRCSLLRADYSEAVRGSREQRLGLVG